MGPQAASPLRQHRFRPPGSSRRPAQCFMFATAPASGESGVIDLVWSRKINPGKVFDLTLALDQVAEGYRAMDERRAIKTLLLP